jgi:hypothetical protein
MPQRDLFVAAHALSRSLFLAAQVGGFLLGGFLMGFIGAQNALLLDALTFLVSYLLIRSQVLRRPAVDAAISSVGLAMKDVGVGTRELMGDPLRRWLVLLAWGSSLFLIAPEAVALGWREPSAPLIGGLLLAAVPAGAAVGFLLIARVSLPQQVPLILPLAALSCLPLFASSINPPSLVAAALWFTSGVLQAWVLTVMASVTALTEASLRGRVVGVASAGFSAATALSFLIIGALADAIGPALAVSLAGLLGLVVVGIAKLRDPGPMLQAAVARADLLSPVDEEIVELVDARGVPVGPDGLPTLRVDLRGEEPPARPVEVEAAAVIADPQPVTFQETAPVVLPPVTAVLGSDDPSDEGVDDGADALRLADTRSLVIGPDPVELVEPEPVERVAARQFEAAPSVTVLPSHSAWPASDPEATQPVPTGRP